MGEYPTTIEEDNKILKEEKNVRMIMALRVRIRVKCILVHQVFLLRLANEINAKIDYWMKSNEKDNVDGLMKLIVARSTIEDCDEFNVKLNRRMLKGYYRRRGVILINA